MPKAKLKKTGSTVPSPEHYMYPKSKTLKNKYGIKDLDTFTARCAHDSAKAIINLREEALPENFNSAYLCSLHQRLFRNTFEWAGCTRNVPFTFADGTTAVAPVMKKITHFAVGSEVEEGLNKLDQTLAAKNNLQGLTREEFTHEAAEIFAFLNYMHPFREGNGRTQRVFLENLAKAAGHKLEFSLVTKERMLLASVAAIENGNLEPMRHLFEDISNPKKIGILKEFMENMKDLGRNVNDRPVMVAKEGETYTGTYRGAGLEGFALNVKGAYIIGPKEHLTPEQVKTLKPGDKCTITIQRAHDLEKILIPEENLAPLTQNECAEMIAQDARVHTCRDQIQKYAKFVYGSSKALNEQMVQMINDTSFGDKLAKQIVDNPHFVARLAGIDFLCFKNQMRANAEKHVNLLGAAVANFSYAVRHTQKEIMQEHQTEQKRRGQKVAMPSQDLQNLLVLPRELQQESLAASPLLQKELSSFVQNVNARLSSNEQKAVKNSDHKTLAESLGVSEHQAQEIAQITKQAKEVHQQSQICRVSRPKVLAMAS
ncbi:Probable adenosine monophosphate-protein transferase fic [Candidatus Bartonella washoeensis]|uniref:protein adenylyltransferase n=1 Tax=Candidatus Bartonella washoeensis Sb944nv TaxID=1094563 RepID=J1J582_9HYPH|nr:BID domain-containing T4SS effector [Bartonella washoeensis]EJF78875.1 hypothetical protein MCQ_01254 [Bartonella washoeensis Sb944nv]SPU27871.1 Probable adenosine monophosphate-protein transferase fic [Bartonella washoeensis]